MSLSQLLVVSKFFKLILLYLFSLSEMLFPFKLHIMRVYPTQTITMMSNEHHGVWNHQEPKYLLNSLLKLTILMLHITDPLWGESSSDHWIPKFEESIYMS